MSEREAPIHFELYRVIQDLISEGIVIHGIKFTKIEPKLRLDSGGEADLVLIDNLGKKWLVIETKRLEEGKYSKLFDPFSPIVIKQAYDYAGELGAPTFATCNKNAFVLFNTFEAFKPLSQRRVMHYDLVGQELKLVLRQILHDVVASQIKPQEVKWTPDYEVLIARFRTLHNLVSPFIKKEFLQLLKNKSFDKKYLDWLDKQGFEDSDDRREIIASETAYLLIDKILFYKTIESKYALPVLEKVTLGDLREGLKKYFDKVVRDIDFQAVFEYESLFDKIPFSPEVRKITNEFIEELKHYNLSQLKSDILGMVYKNLIPKDEKKRYGQYYTDADVCELIVKLCVKDSDDLILDPACGSGTFLIKAYHRLRELKHKENPLWKEEQIHRKVLKQLYGVEINQFPAHLSVMQITMQNPKAKSDKINVLVNDFFKTHQLGLNSHKITDLAKQETDIDIPAVNVIVGNPPYIRQEGITDKKWVRSVALIDCKDLINEKSDIYVYFFTYGLNFLKNNGHFGFITSNSWLDVEFGEGLQKLFLKKSKIKCIIAFDVNVFEDGLANTCITVLQKTNGDAKERKNNIVKFVRIKKPSDIKQIVKLIETKKDNYEDEFIKIIPIKQESLEKEKKWGRFHKAPPIFFKILESKKITTLNKVANITYPFPGKTSANEFFILDKATAKHWGIEKEYLKPIATSPKDLKNLKIDKKIDYLFLNVNEPKTILKKNKANVLKYIEHGERKKIIQRRGTKQGEEITGYQNLPSLKNKKIWYGFITKKTKIEPAKILFPAMYWNKYPIFWNDGKLLSTHNFYEVIPYSDDNSLLLLGFLNSTLNPLCMELYGRVPGGRTLEIMVYEVEQLPVLDPDKIIDKEKKQIENAFLNLVKVQEKGKDDTKAREKLDNAVFDVLGLNQKQRKEVYEGLEEVKKIRQEGLIRVKSPKVKTSGLRGKKALMKEGVQLTSLHQWFSKE